MNEVLTQDEIEALLANMSSDSPDGLKDRTWRNGKDSTLAAILQAIENMTRVLGRIERLLKDGQDDGK